MKILANVVAILVILVGAVWALQGANLIGGSVMSGEPLWLFVGIGLAIAGIGALWWTNVARPSRS